MSNQDTLKQTALWFQKAVPVPSSKNLHTQLGCHFEEVAEMLAAIDTDDCGTATILLRAEVAISNLADHLKAGDNLIKHGKDTKLLDAICDQIVTATGVGYMYGYQTVPALEEINASNWSKFVDNQPVFDANQKIQKGPDYFKANLTPFI